ncbi:MAG: hypothetical protein PWQ41_634 [Bacillota bacterium]|jgi:hypothetical protein|nr:hypothetical protein [Bacillota bacterium]MDK2855018.1 hypothetical protein [Bacillota bacterium]MDK2924860.1 hypothetical protein [Bacillota bacterium]
MAVWMDLLFGTLFLAGVLFFLAQLAVRRYGNRNRS